VGIVRLRNSSLLLLLLQISNQLLFFTKIRDFSHGYYNTCYLSTNFCPSFPPPKMYNTVTRPTTQPPYRTQPELSGQPHATLTFGAADVPQLVGAAERTLISRCKNYRRHRCVSCRQRDAATHTSRLQVGWYIICMASEGGGGEVVK
jgi:hypothetical protein